jgi:excisionase family DNA binding protein
MAIAAMKELTEQQAAKRLGVKKGTLTNWRSRGEGPAYVKVGKFPRYTSEAIEEYLRSRTMVPKSAKTRRRKGAK